ncbi:MAG TPA: nuclear transport factor 2 family protein [Candidatus Acidoferrum sp.]|nr:nuclear transport factor 2 family protein [Candidatus Acidoferrum sp.]
MRTLALLLCLSLSVSLALLAQEKSQMNVDEGKILALEAVWNRAEQAKDINALSKIFAPNMTYIDSDGSFRTRDQFLAHIKSENDAPDQLVTEEVATRAFGDCIVVTGMYRGKWTKNGKNNVIKGRFTDTWAKIDGNWQCVASQATGLSH